MEGVETRDVGLFPGLSLTSPFLPCPLSSTLAHFLSVSGPASAFMCVGLHVAIVHALESSRLLCRHQPLPQLRK